MFRPLKSFYFLSSKYYIVNNRWQKSLRIIRRYSSSTNNFNPRDKAISLLVNHSEPDWKEILGLMRSSGSGDGEAQVFIMNCCGENRLGNQMLSFLKFLIKNDNLSVRSLKKFLYIVKHEKYYQPCYPVVHTLLKKFIAIDISIAEVCVVILLNSPIYFDGVFEICQTYMKLFNNRKEIVTSLLKSNKLEEAFKLYNLSRPDAEMEDFMVKYLKGQLKNGRIPIKLTETVINLIRRTYYNNQLPLLHPDISNIMNLINEKEKDYRWSMKLKQCIDNKCQSCGKNLETSSVTDDELKFLMSELESKVVSQYLSLSCFYKKWHNFKNFLKHTNYDIVVDGLNVLHRIKLRRELLKDIIVHFQLKGKTPLVISRSHSRTIFSNYLTDNSAAYYTDNIEYDDIYVLYAALKSGKGCFVFTMDKYGFFFNSLKGNSDIFQRWKETHFSKFSMNGKVIWPNSVKMGLQQENCDDPSEFKCHIIEPSYESYNTLYCIQHVRLNK